MRVDHPDVVFTHREAKNRAVVEEIRRVHATGRPILVGTVSVQESEELAGAIEKLGIDCAVLNATTRRAGGRRSSPRRAPRGGDDLDEHGRPGHRHPARRPGRARARARRRAGRSVRHRHEPPREPAHRRPAPRPRGAPGRPGCDALLRQPRGPADRALRGEPSDSREATGPPQQAPLDHPGDPARDRAGPAHRRGREPRDPPNPHALHADGRGAAAAAARAPAGGACRHGSRLEQAVSRASPRVVRRMGARCRRRGRAPDHAGPDRPRSGASIWRSRRPTGGDSPAERHAPGSVWRSSSAKIIEAYDERRRELDEAIAETLRARRVWIRTGSTSRGRDCRSPASTWTYVVSDDPFRNQLYAGLGGTAMGLGIVFNFPIVLGWWLYARRGRKKRELTASSDRDRAPHR